jgi:hypothetical protein
MLQACLIVKDANQMSKEKPKNSRIIARLHAAKFLDEFYGKPDAYGLMAMERLSFHIQNAIKQWSRQPNRISMQRATALKKKRQDGRQTK